MIVVPSQASWNDAMASSMAFFWAEEPSALSVPPPSGQSDAAVDPELDEPEAAGSLLSEPHAVSARLPTRATLARRPMRWIFTVFKPLQRESRENQRRAVEPDAPKVGRESDAAARGG